MRVAIHGQSFKGGPVSENLAASYPAAKPGYVNMENLHTSLSGDVEHDPYAPCKLEDLTTRGYDYWALGHIHKGAKLLDDPWVVYPGNLQGRHAKETGPKGCMLVEVDDDRISTVELVDLAVVRWQLAVVDLKGKTREADLVEAIRGALAHTYKAADSRPTAVRLILGGETPLHDAIERRPSRLLQTVLELAAEIGGDDIWIEKIRNDTVPPLIAPSSQASDTANDLTQIMEEVANDTGRVNALLQKELKPLRTKLPEELKGLPALKFLDDPSLVLSALNSTQAAFSIAPCRRGGRLMRISSLHLSAYGHFTDYSLRFGDKPGLHLVYGADEPGKSTSLRALSSVLFGYPSHVIDGFKFDAKDIAIGADLVGKDGRTLSYIRRRRGKNWPCKRQTEHLWMRPPFELSRRNFEGGVRKGIRA